MISFRHIVNILNNKTILNGAAFSLFSFVNKGFSFLLLLIIARYITPQEYGYLSLFSTVTMVISYFICMSTEGYMSVAFFKESKDEFNRSYTTIVTIGLIMTLFFCVVLLLFGSFISRILNLPLSMLFFAVLICFFTSMANLNLDFFRLQERLVFYDSYSCGNAFLNFVISIVFVNYLLLSWQGRVYAQFIGAFLFGIVSLLFFGKKHMFSFNIKDKIKPILLWGIPIIPHLATYFIRQGCDRYIINYTHSIYEVGLFSFALDLVNVISMVGFGFNQTNSVSIYKVLGDKLIPGEEKKSIINKANRYYRLIYIVAAVVIPVVFYFSIPVILPKYKDAMNYMLVLSVYAFLQCIYLIYCNFLFFYGKTKKLMYITFISSAIHLILSLLLTRYSLYLTGCIYCITQLIVVLMVRREAKRLLAVNLSVQ